MTDEADVLIIGAGMSGLSAACHLREESSSSSSPPIKVMILEGREDRIGGRLHTAHLDHGTYHVDIGGAWLMDPDNNPIAKYLDGVSQHPTPSAAVFGFDGVEFDESRVAKLQEMFATWQQEAKEKAKDAATTVKATELFPMLAEDHIAAATTSVDEKAAAIMCRAVIESWMACSLEQLKGRVVAKILDTLVPQNLLKQGYQVALDRMAEHHDIRMNHVVTKINILPDDGGAKVTTQDGSVFAAKKVICTLPIGVLKSNKVTFDPPLPEKKQLAIDRIGAGVMNKVVLRFSEVFWKKEKDWHFHLTEDRTLANTMINLANITNEPILVAFHIGIPSMDNEAKSDKELGELAMTSLRNTYGPDIPDPEEVVCTRWGTDPMSLCAYAAPFDSDNFEEDTNALAASVDGTLFFAGEATMNEPGTAHGAFHSGVRAAKEAMKA